MDTMMPPGEMPPETEAPADLPDENKLLDDADADGKLEPLKAYLAEEGLSEDPKEVLKLAQEDERTRGKSPDELAGMLAADSALLDDLMAYAEGGMFGNAQKKGELPKLGEKKPSPDKAADEMSEDAPPFGK